MDASNRDFRLMDFVFIDAGHDYEDVKEDIEAWLPHIKDGGLIIGHDYSDDFPGVKQAVNEAFGDAVQTESNVWWVDLRDLQNDVFEEDHAIISGVVDGKPTEFDETIVIADDRRALKRMMSECFGRMGKENRKAVYIGSPDPGTLDEMAQKAQTFCVVNEKDKRLPYALSFFDQDQSVKFVRYSDPEDVLYEGYWDDGDADIVFIERTYSCIEFIQRAMDLLNANGILCGNGEIIEDAFDGTPIGQYRDSGLWGITKADYTDALESNGKTSQKVRES